MTVRINQVQNSFIDSSIQESNQEGYNVSVSNFLENIDPQITQIFEELSQSLDEKTKLTRAMSLSLHLSNGPMFRHFEDGDFPEGMPNDLKTSIKAQNKEWEELQTQKEKNVYTLNWMIDRIGHEVSSDPEFKDFLQDIYTSYTGDETSSYQTRDEKNDEDGSLQKFRDDLTSKGALKFLYDFNMEKIEEMVQKYRDELLKNLGEDPSPQELAEVEKMVEDYRKQLLEELAELNDTEKNSPLNINRLEFKMMNNFKTTLEDVLKAQ